MSKKYTEKKYLKENYRLTAKTHEDIASDFDISPGTIAHHLSKHNIEKLHFDEKFLSEKVVYEGRTIRDVADNCIPYEISEATISNRCAEYGIKHIYKEERWLRWKYNKRGLSAIEIANEIGVCPQTILNWLHKNDIETVSIDDRWNEYEPPLSGVTGDDHPTYDIGGKDHPMWNVTGEDHPRYKNGSSHENWRDGYLWNYIRDEVVARDNYTCNICDSDVNLHVHHIVPVSEGGRKHDPYNLTTLCEECHIDVHKEMKSNVDTETNDVDWVTPETAPYA